MKKLFFSIVTALCFLKAEAKIHITYGYTEAELLSVKSHKHFQNSYKVDSTNDTFVFESLIKGGEKQNSSVALRTMNIVSDLEILEDYRAFVLVFNDEKGYMGSDSIMAYTAILLPQKPNLTLAYIMKHLIPVQDIGREAAAAERKNAMLESAKMAFDLLERKMSNRTIPDQYGLPRNSNGPCNQSYDWGPGKR